MLKSEYWDTTYKLTKIPPFKCPTCEHGILLYQKDKFLKEEKSISRQKYEATVDPEDLQYCFTCLIICNNDKCLEIATVSGTINLWQNGCEDTFDIETGTPLDIPENIPKYENHYLIENISLPINLISIPKEIDTELKYLIEQSFKLFWLDSTSCANKIRISLEYLLSKKIKIPNKKKCKDKKQSTQNKPIFYLKNLTLGDKISELKSNPKFVKYKYLSDNLKAIKWIGNEGSHNGKSVARKELIEVYKILELILTEIYCTKKKEVNRLTKQINKKYSAKKNKVKT